MSKICFFCKKKWLSRCFFLVGGRSSASATARKRGERATARKRLPPAPVLYRVASKPVSKPAGFCTLPFCTQPTGNDPGVCTIAGWGDPTRLHQTKGRHLNRTTTLIECGSKPNSTHSDVVGGEVVDGHLPNESQTVGCCRLHVAAIKREVNMVNGLTSHATALANS